MIKPGAPVQLPFDLARAPGFSREELLVTPANAQAVDLIDRWPDWPSPVVILAGPAGSGKSHLGAIWRDRSGAAAFDRRAIGGDAPLAFIADADAGGLDQTGLFHLINSVRSANGALLLTARRFPAAWGVTLPDLASRLKAAATVEVHEPDDALLAGVITKLFADRQVEVEPLVVSFLVRRIERSLAAAMYVVERLDALALDRQSRITRALAGEVVSAMEQGRGEPPL